MLNFVAWEEADLEDLEDHVLKVGCVDGAHFAMLNPGVSVDDCLRYYGSRKDCHAHLTMAVYDADRRFLAFDITHGPSTHDSLAFAATKVSFPFSPVFMCLLMCSSATAWPSSKRKHVRLDHANCCPLCYPPSCVRCAFGILVRRWGILWRT